MPNSKPKSKSQIDREPELAAAVQELRRTVELIGDSYNSELKLELSATQKAELQQVGADKQVRASQSRPLDVQKLVRVFGAGCLHLRTDDWFCDLVSQYFDVSALRSSLSRFSN